MSKRGETRKNDQLEACLNQPSDPSDTPLPDDMSDEADPPNRAILASITNLRNEVTQIKNDICASIDARIQTVCTELREELATTKKEIQKSITTLEGATTLHENTSKELEKSPSLHADDVTALQRQVTRLNSKVGRQTLKKLKNTRVIYCCSGLIIHGSQE